MVRAFGRSVWAATAAILWIGAACRDSAAPNTEPSYLLGDLTGNIAITAATTGSNLDPDGYTVTVDVIAQSQSIPTNGSVTFTGVVPGVATVSISGVASNCTVSGGNLSVVTVPVGGTVSTTFSISCAPTGPTTGSLSVTTATSGASGDLDPDGYTVTLDGTTSRAIGINASVTFTELTPGSHTVVLSGVAGNCTVSGGASRTVSVTAGSTASTSYSVSCAPTGPTTGSLSVTTATSGASGDLDPDGYTVTLDGTTSRAIGINASVTFTGLTPGSHSVVLSGVAGNCTVSGGTSRTVSVTAGSTASTSYSISCAPTGPTTGSLTVTAATSGASGDIDPDGYTVSVDGGAASQPIPANGSVTFTGPAGDHSIALTGVAANCTVSGANPRTVTVPAGGTATTTFSVSCAPTGPTTGSLSVTTATSGASGDLDPDGYTVTLDGATSRAIGINASVTFTGLTPGSHSVVLSGVAANCTVSGGTSRTVSVTAGSTASTSYSVSCAPTGPTTGSLTVTAATSGASGDIDPDGYTVSVDGGAASQPIPANGSVTFTGPAGDHSVALTGVATNCTVSGANPRTVTVPAGGTASTTFSVSCAPTGPTTGSLSVTTATSGASGDLDPDGYTVTLDGATSRAIGINASVTFTGLTPGSHSVVLSGVAANCTVSGGTSRTVSVTAGSTASTSYSVSCAPTSPGTGSLTVTTATSGASGDLDPDGYTVSVDGGAASQPIATNGSVTFTGPAGDHSVALTGVATNCTVSGANPRTVNVPAGGTATTTFSVSCAGAPPPPPPASRVTGQGQVGTAAPQPGNNVQTFDFDVRADLTGRFTGTDYSDLHPGGVPATLTTDHAADPATSITAFRSSSSACSDPSRGVEFDAIGREDTGGLVGYTIAVCDNGPANSGLDFFSVFIPSEGFGRSGQVASGDIVKS